MDANLTKATDAAADARAEIHGLAIADPQRLVDAILQVLSDQPILMAQLMHQVRAQMPTIRGPSPARAPTDEERAFIRSNFQHLKAPKEVRLQRLITPTGEYDLSVRAGSEAAIVGGSLVNLDAIALAVADTPGERGDAATAIAELVTEQLGGPVTKHSVTKRPSTSRPMSTFVPRRLPASQHELESDPALATIHAIQAYWPSSQNTPRKRGESNNDYATRLDGLLIAAAAAGDKQADAALDKLRKLKPPTKP